VPCDHQNVRNTCDGINRAVVVGAGLDGLACALHLAETFAAVGEHLADWVDPDRMEHVIADMCGPRIAASYRAYAEGADGRVTLPFLRGGRTREVRAWNAGLAPTLTADLYFARGGMGRDGERSWPEVMSDPPLLVTHPTGTDNSAAPPGRDTYCVQVPAPDLDLGLHLEVSHVPTPATFARLASLGPGSLPSTVVSTRLAVGVPMLLHAGRLAALRVLA